jgi:hypothetical protein
LSSYAPGEREIAIPAAALSALADALRNQGGQLAAIHGLHAGGYGAGAPFFERLSAGAPRDLTALGEREFWRALSRFLSRKGWGTVSHSSPHPGVGLLVSRDWAEAQGVERPQPSCAFSVGLLSHLLTRAADAPVAVLEVTCRSAGDAVCTFAFGSETTVQDLYRLLLDGRGLEQALAEL